MHSFQIIGSRNQTVLNKLHHSSFTKMASSATQASGQHVYPLEFEVLKKCSKSKARCSVLKLPHATLETPQFMPVGTKGTLKGMLPHQIKELGCNLILANTYHLGTRPVGESFLSALKRSQDG
jgi:hypothetical protein